MSYILDALRKSDQLRQRGAAPTLLLGQVTATAPRQPARIYYVVLALVLLGAGIAIGWLRPWQPEPAVAPRVATAPNLPAKDPILVPPEVGQMQLKPEPGQQVQNLSPVATARESAAVPAPESALPLPTDEDEQLDPEEFRVNKKGQRRKPPAAPATKVSRTLPVQTAGTAIAKSGVAVPAVPVSNTNAANTNAAAANTPNAVNFSELPLAIQQELPPLSISVHAYSGKAAERLVGINGRLLHEGDDAAPGLRLEQITPEGMILSYKGLNFRRGVH